MVVRLDPPRSQCPYCGCEEFTIRLRVSGVIYEHHRFDGDRAENVGMWDNAHTRAGKTAYCRDCDKRIARIIE